jgi:serine O-acetyltransferase
LNSVLTGAQISCNAVIGKGLTIYHPQGIVVGGTAVIGDYCTLTHGNMIGQLHGGGDRPIIGDHFYAGTGAKILGKIAIGNNVRVGANSVVLQPLGDDVTAFGIPARVVGKRVERQDGVLLTHQPPGT